MRLGRPLPERLGFWGPPREDVDSILDLAIKEEAMPGGRVVVAHRGQIVLDRSVGTLDGNAPVTSESLYDLASITKVAATANALMHLHGTGVLDLEAPMAQLLPELKDHALGQRTPRQLLTHQAGLESWIPFYRRALADSSGVFCEEANDSCSIEVTPGMFMKATYSDSIWKHILEADLDPPEPTSTAILVSMFGERCFANGAFPSAPGCEKTLPPPCNGRAWGTTPFDKVGR
jgi:hypothetical protein